MKKCIAVLLVLLASGCAPREDKIPGSDAIRVVEGFFEALDVENTDPELLDRYITQDFIIYEAGRKMDRDEFLELVHGAPVLESDWELSDFRVSTDNNSAHISLFNRGNFVVQTDSVQIRQHYEWLESAYLIKEEDTLKIKFYFSDNIGVQSDTIK